MSERINAVATQEDLWALKARIQELERIVDKLLQIAGVLK